MPNDAVTEEVETHEGDGLRRRTMIGGLAAAGVGATVLAACGGGSDGSTKAVDPGAASSSTAGGPLAGTADVEVGGAVFLEDPSVVITQPVAGEFHAFDRACTHQGCPVVDIVDGNIHCNCHGSLFSMTDGSPVSGPAGAPLAKVDITVDGDQILPA